MRRLLTALVSLWCLHPARLAAVEQSVVVEITGNAQFAPGLAATIGELLGRLGVTVTHTRTAAHAPLAEIRIQLDARGAQVTRQASRSTDAPVRRRVPLGESWSLFREALGHVVLGLVEPLVLEVQPLPSPEPSGPVAPAAEPAPPPVAAAAEPAPPSVAAAAEPAPPPVAVLEPAVAPASVASEADDGELEAAPAFVRGGLTPTLHAALGARAGLVLLGDVRPAARLAGAAALTSGRVRRPGGVLELGGVWPRELHSAAVDAALRLLSARARATLRALEGRRTALEVQLGGGLDWLRLRSRAAPSHILSQGRIRRVQAVASVQLSARYALSERISFLAQLGADLDLMPRTFVVQGRGGEAELWTTGRVRPYLVLGSDWSIMGRSGTSRPESAP